MKLIQSMWSDIIKVEDRLNNKSFLLIQKNKLFTKYYSENKNEELYLLNFNLENIKGLLRRWRIYKNIKRDINFYNNINYYQLLELYMALYDDAREDGIIAKKDDEYIDKKKRIKTIKFNNNSNKWTELFFRSKRDFLLLVDFHKESKNSIYLDNIQLSWDLRSLTKKEFKKVGKKFILNKDENKFTKNKLFLYKYDLIDFLSTTNQLLNKIEKLKKI